MRRLVLSVSAILITACTTAVASRPAASDAAAPASPRDSAATSDSATDHLRRTGRRQAELLRDNDFRVALEDLRRLDVVLDFEEIQFGLLRVVLGPGFATVSSARYNLEHLYAAYRIASYRNEGTVIELWRDRAKIGEVTGSGVRLGATSTDPR